MQWLLAIVLSGLVGALWTDAPTWILAVLTGLVALGGVTFLLSHVFLMLKDPESLRSERFTLDKMAIEKGLMGDNLAGEFRRLPGTNTGGDEPQLRVDDEPEAS